MSETQNSFDVVLIGGGIMSATLGAMLKILQPDWSVAVYERLDEVATESSSAWNNAGTGHAANCELNYTPKNADGTIDASKAYSIHEQFELSKQFWAYLVEHKLVEDPTHFLAQTPHMSFVIGEEDVSFLKKRYEILKQHHFFKDMKYSEDYNIIKVWSPLLLEGRPLTDKIAATYMETGTDVNFGALTTYLFDFIQKQDKVSFNFNHDVKDLKKNSDGTWRVKVKNTKTNITESVTTKFVFIGAGGRALQLIQKSGIPEGKGFGGFPVSGQWLRCTNPEIIQQHHTKVYGKAAVGAPPMSVPHLDTRHIKGERELLFGPYAGFSTKFLKHGSYWDLPCSITLNNIYPMVRAGWANMSLTKYLINQVKQSEEDRLNALRDYYPAAKSEDWILETAGQRVQIIKKDKNKGGVLQFGTEVVTSSDGTVSALLGASPGASTAVHIMIHLIERCFGRMLNSEWTPKLKAMIPSYGKSLKNDAVLSSEVIKRSNEILGIKA
ncbi:MAG TPA: malate:quinone oxidoreductase [Edaphocola sp.]|nr:malate:quinone oxidoreductase [Edaphocola sp.]